MTPPTVDAGRRQLLLGLTAAATLPAMPSARAAVPAFQVLTPGEADPVVLFDGWVIRLSEVPGFRAAAGE